ncbi:hypothetical protein GWI33_018476 [Rhynchophorus ferrugineus]|uniref:Uncharacterized protein n=1 Tax=Rhynchophorus ferrugineus TaxID=354439 RepID=A0A834M1F4_RHYFE|nr:hypothetical protein GWI33_018476 [Rhynchophorus ferrugineus]
MIHQAWSGLAPRIAALNGQFIFRKILVTGRFELRIANLASARFAFSSPPDRRAARRPERVLTPQRRCPFS